MNETHQARFERIRRELGPAISRVVASYAPAAERDDLAQEVMLALWRALPRFRGEASERTFALRIAHNRGLNHLWRRAPAGDAEAEPVDPRPAPDDQAVRREQTERLYAAIRRLPVGLRQVLTLALEDLPHAEIAEVLGISVDNVAVRLSRARAALRDSMKEEP